MKTLYLMRHGETRFNQLHKIQGACDSPLTDTGMIQARIAGLWFSEHGISFDNAYSSTQERASDTLEFITDFPYQRVKGLKEWDFGRFEAESEALNPKEVPYGDFFTAYGGESQQEVEKRMLDTLIALMKKSGNTVLAVSHGGAIACFTRATGSTLPKGLKNCCILKFCFENDKFKLQEVINHDFSDLGRSLE